MKSRRTSSDRRINGDSFYILFAIAEKKEVCALWEILSGIWKNT
jgi:hypothetical protein